MQSLFLAPGMCILSFCAAITLALGIKSTMNHAEDVMPGTLPFLLLFKQKRRIQLSHSLVSPPKKSLTPYHSAFLVNLGSTYPGLKGVYTGISCVALGGLFFGIYASSEYVQYRRRHINGDKVRLRSKEREMTV